VQFWDIIALAMHYKEKFPSIAWLSAFLKLRLNSCDYLYK